MTNRDPQSHTLAGLPAGHTADRGREYSQPGETSTASREENREENKPFYETLEEEEYPQWTAFEGDVTLFSNARRRDKKIVYPEKNIRILNRNEKRLMPTHEVAIIYEHSSATLIKSDAESTGSSVTDTYDPTKGPLAVGEFYQHLLAPRFKGRGTNSGKGKHRGPNLKEDGPINQRVIYIANIDAWTAPALVLPAQQKEAQLRADFIQDFLGGESSSRISPPAIRGRPAAFFSLEFQLFFHVLRRGKKAPVTDKRWGGDAKLCRKSQQLLSLNKTGKAWLHEAKTACLVFGNRTNDWDAHVLVDDYYEGEDSDDNVQSYEDYSSSRFSYCLPTRGAQDERKALNTPQEYFLTVLNSRLATCSREERAAVQYLQDKMNKFGRIPSSNTVMSPQEATGRQAAMERQRKTVSDLINLSITIEASLSLILQNFDAFSNPNPYNLLRGIEPNSTTHEKINSLCHDIQGSLAIIRTACLNLNKLMVRGERFEKEYEIEMKVNSDKAISVQRLTLILSAPGLSANLLQSGVVSGKPNWLQFFIIAVAIWLLLQLTDYLTTFKLFVVDFIRRYTPWARLLGLEQPKLHDIDEARKSEEDDDDDDDDYDDGDEDGNDGSNAGNGGSGGNEGNDGNGGIDGNSNNDDNDENDDNNAGNGSNNRNGSNDSNDSKDSNDSNDSNDNDNENYDNNMSEEREGPERRDGRVDADGEREETATGRDALQAGSSNSGVSATGPAPAAMNQRKGKRSTSPPDLPKILELPVPVTYSTSKGQKSFIKLPLELAGAIFSFSSHKAPTNSQRYPDKDIEMSQAPRHATGRSNSGSWYGQMRRHQEP